MQSTSNPTWTPLVSQQPPSLPPPPSVSPIVAGPSKQRRQRSASDAEDAGKEKKKRVRTVMSCSQCKKRKVKCDRNSALIMLARPLGLDIPVPEPCEACVRHGCADDCNWENGAPETQLPFALASDFRRLEQRYQAVEHFLIKKFGADDSSLAQALASVSTPSSTGTPQVNSIPSLRHPFRGTDPDTEDAATVLEELAMGPAIDIKPHIDPETPKQIGTTTIFLIGDGVAHTDGLFSGKEILHRILDSLPTDECLRGLVASAEEQEIFFRGVNHVPTIYAELYEFCQARRDGSVSRVDPAYIAFLLMILVTGVEELDDRLDTVFGYKRTDLKKRSETWISAARTALDLAGWQSEAKFRSLQTIHLIIYTSLVSFWRSNRKVTNGIWLSAALQIAQTLGLHQLGSEDTTMPPDDPGLPHGACALKRQMALRIWHHLTFFDLMMSFKAPHRCIVRTEDTNYAIPGNIDDSALVGGNLLVPAQPDSVRTSSSFYSLKLKTANFFRKTAEVDLETANLPDEQAAKRWTELDDLFDHNISPSFAAVCNGMPVELRGVLLSGTSNRIMRAHRYYALKGHTDSRFAASSRCYLKRALAICHAQREAPPKRLFFLERHAMAATLALFEHRYAMIDAGTPERDEHQTTQGLDILVSVFTRLRQDKAANVRYAAEKSIRIISGLRNAEADRRRHPRAEPFVQVLRRVGDATKIVLPLEATEGLANGSAPLPPTATAALEPLFRIEDPTLAGADWMEDAQTFMTMDVDWVALLENGGGLF